MLYLIFALILLWLCWPLIRRLVQAFMMRRAEDMLRRMMGMPSGKEQRRRERRNNSRNSSARQGARQDSSRWHRAPGQDAAEMLKAVAEDVEFVEYKEFESEETAAANTRQKRRFREEQVSDVEYVEIRAKNNRK
ncbi:MAG: hypothetical protein NC204_04085 [Candidatus Amulumruptor caecigallinarius]|nr:hypothetical protein [Candidatus Amulumruptor caecigallinarius]